MKRLRELTAHDISAHRSFLYGFSALLILLSHTITRIPSRAVFAPLRWLKYNGPAGVEIFVIMAVICAYGSLENNPDVLGFYRRRFRRVALPAFIVCCIAFGLADYGFWEFLSAVTFFPYWFGGKTLWFVPFILTLYLIYPWIYRLQKRRPKALWALLVVGVVVSWCSCHDIPGGFENLLLSAMRAPVFILGCMMAPWAVRSGRIPRWTAPACLAAYIAIALLPEGTTDSFLRSTSYIPLSVFLIIAATRLAMLTEGRLLYRFAAFCGGISLEIYLIYTRLLYFMEKLPFYSGGRLQTLALEIATMLLTFVMSAAINKVCMYRRR